MKKLLIILMFLMETSCSGIASIRLVKKYRNINPEFRPYINEFIKLSNGKVSEKDFRGFTMGFKDYSDKESGIVGTCHYSVLEVDISRRWWNETRSQMERFELIFHELGHCILKRGHTLSKPYSIGIASWLERLAFRLGILKEKGYLLDGCPASFMHPFTLSEFCVSRHLKYYMKELFENYDGYPYIMRNIILSMSTNKRMCKTPKIINKTKYWNNKDQQTLNRAKKRCIERYKSCLKIFWKKSNDDYAVLCE